MEAVAHITQTTIAEQRKTQQIINKEQGRLLGFIKKQVDNLEDAEDILQDTFFQFAEADTFLKPIEQATAWLYTVARNKITDLFRKKKPISESMLQQAETENEFGSLFNALLSDDNVEFDYSRSLLKEEIELALAELPSEQREAFVQHELEGKSFKQLSEETGASVNTLISRKRYAVLHLRERLKSIYDEFLND